MSWCFKLFRSFLGGYSRLLSDCYCVLLYVLLGVGGVARKVDLETVPQINGQSLLEMDLGEAADKPWKLPGECM